MALALRDAIDLLRRRQLLGATFTHRRLTGGLSNASYLLAEGAARFVLRLNRPQVGVDREREARVLETIAGHDWAPEVVYCNPDQGLLLYRFIDAPPWSLRNARSKAGQSAMGYWLATLHGVASQNLPAVNTLAALDEFEAAMPGPPNCRWQTERTLARAAYREAFEGVPTVLCHGDLVAANILGTTGISTVIDWEFAGRAPAELDLAWYIHYQKLDLHTAAPLLDSYSRAGDVDRPRLSIALRWVRLLDRAWRYTAASRSACD